MIKIIQESSVAHNNIQKSQIHKWVNNDFRDVDDLIAVESPLEIRLGYHHDKFQTLATTMCSPSDIKDLVIGYLYTENIIHKHADIIKIETFDNEIGKVAEVLISKKIDVSKYFNKRHGVVHASCGICGKTNFDDLLTYKYRYFNPLKKTIEPEIIFLLPEILKSKQHDFNQTGGLHASTLFNVQGEILNIREDIGRHNALDKVIGSALQQELLPLKNHIVLLSGRVSFELVHKSLMAGVTTLCAIGAPSSLSIEIAQTNNLNLFGFVKSDTYNQYC